MKHITIILLILLMSCTKKQDSKKNEDQLIIEGTVVKILNFLIPSAHASSLTELLDGKDNDCDNVCAALVDISNEPNKLIKIVPVINGRFKIIANKDLHIELYKIFIFNKQKQITRTFVFDQNEPVRNIEVNPNSTALSDYKENLIRKKVINKVQLIEEYKQKIAELELILMSNNVLELYENLTNQFVLNEINDSLDIFKRFEVIQILNYEYFQLMMKDESYLLDLKTKIDNAISEYSCVQQNKTMSQFKEIEDLKNSIDIRYTSLMNMYEAEKSLTNLSELDSMRIDINSYTLYTYNKIKQKDDLCKEIEPINIYKQRVAQLIEIRNLINERLLLQDNPLTCLSNPNYSVIVENKLDYYCGKTDHL